MRMTFNDKEKAIAYAQKQVNDAQAVLDNAEAGYKSWIESRSTICPYEKQLHHSVVSRFKDRLHKAEQLLEQIILSDASSWEWDVCDIPSYSIRIRTILA